ncbi:short-chain dehydrogenase/reductase SDR [Hyaloraphidium curvatum]|nr:short-chain dehydrogenase/reductase SDR [Hyaloraphidium curvatum]
MAEQERAAYRSRLSPRAPNGRRRAILITGASAGMGLATARLFAAKGFLVVAVDVVEEGETDAATGRVRPGLAALRRELGEDNVLTAKLDVADKPGFEALVGRLERELPARCNSPGAVLDVVFANAGIARSGLWPETPFETHMDVVRVNLIGVLVTIYCSLALMKREPGGLVISTASATATFGWPGAGTYSATKHGVKGLTESLSVELPWAYGLRAADVLPGVIETSLVSERAAPRYSNLPASHPNRLLPPGAIAEAVWAAWANDPDGVDSDGHSTKDRLHWYVPLTLHTEVDAVVHAPGGGAERMRERYKVEMWHPTKAMREAADRAMGKL